LAAFNARLVHLARQLQVMRGRKLRTDGTVVETHITYPTDNKLMAAGVQVLSCTLKRAQTLILLVNGNVQPAKDDPLIANKITY
jgi:hypothetical protein